MPEEKYGFWPTAGKFDSVRTFAEEVKHLSATPDSLKSKAEIMEYLKGSFALLHRAATAINERNQTEVIKPFENRTDIRPGLIVDALCHSWNHYGQIVEYLRMNGIVPPVNR